MMMYGLSDQTVAAIKAVFSRTKEIEEAILYGSRAQNTFRPASDIDITLKGEGLNLSLLSNVATELDDLLLPYTIDLSLFHQINNPELIEQITKTGITLYRSN